LWQGVATLLGFFLQPVLEASSSALFDIICISVIPAADIRCFFALSAYLIYIYYCDEDVLEKWPKNDSFKSKSRFT
jgi:hypothetical protein